MPVAAVNGQQIKYHDNGTDGPAIVWSHGFLMDHTMFEPQIRALAGASSGHLDLVEHERVEVRILAGLEF